MTSIRLPKSELYADEMHSKPFLIWIQEQATRISSFANIIMDLKDGTDRRAISPQKIQECAARFVDFYVKNIAFKKIYEDLRDSWKEKSDILYDEMYLDTKKQVSDHTSEMGSKYKKKEATQSEIEREMRCHIKYSEFVTLLTSANEYKKKAETQDEFIKGLGKLDLILNMLQKATQMELKYLYLET